MHPHTQAHRPLFLNIAAVMLATFAGPAWSAPAAGQHAGPPVAAAGDPRPTVVLIGGKNACAWDSGLGWADLLVEERLEWNVVVRAHPDLLLWRMLEKVDAILAGCPRPSVVVIAAGTMECSFRTMLDHDAAAQGEAMRQLIRKIQAACPEATTVVVTPLPVVAARMKSAGRILFSDRGEDNCRAVRHALVEAARATGARVVDLYDYAWQMNRHPSKPDDKPGAPGFVMGSIGYEIRDWGPAMIVPWIAEQLDAIGPRAFDAAAYERWLTTWKAQQAADASAGGVAVSHGPALAAAGDGRARVPVELLRGPALDLLIKVESGQVDVQPCVSARQPDLVAGVPALTVETDGGPVQVRVRPGHWQILKEEMPDKPHDVHEFYTTAHNYDTYFARMSAQPGRRMWVLVRFLLGDLRGKEPKEGRVAIPGGGRRLAFYPVLGSDSHWHPAKATWKTRDGRIPWTGGEDGAPRQTAVMAVPAPTHGCAPSLDPGVVSAETERKTAAVAPIPRKEAIAADLARIERQLAEFGGGSWDSWNASLAAFREDVRVTTQGKWPWPAKHNFVFQGAAVQLLRMDAVDAEMDGKGALDFLVRLDRHFKSANTDLILVPIPDKVAVYPDYLSAKAPSNRVVNVAIERLMYDLLRQDVEVIDLFTPFREFRDRVKDAIPLYYTTDSHWLNLAAELAAKQLAPRLHRYPFVREAEAKGNPYVARQGMRILSETPDVLRRILYRDGRIYQADEASPIMLTGDSFSAMNVGEHSASFPAQIAYEIGMPLACLSGEGLGPSGVGVAVARAPESFAARRVMIVSFISRSLMGSPQWPSLTYGKIGAPAGKAVRDLQVTCTVTATSEKPPARSEYKDFLMQFLVADLRDAEGRAVGSGKGVVYILAMKDRRILPAADTGAGAQLRLAITSWGEVEKAYGRVQTGTLADLNAILNTPCYYGQIEGTTATPAGSVQ